MKKDLLQKLMAWVLALALMFSICAFATEDVGDDIPVLSQQKFGTEAKDTECKHEKTYINWVILNGEYVDIDEIGHTFVGEIAAEHNCRHCGYSWIEMSTKKSYTVRGEHRNNNFDGEGCEDCGYVCNHEKEYMSAFFHIDELTYLSFDCTYHTVSGKTLGFYECDICGNAYTKEVTLKNKMEKHLFSDGACVYCSYVKQGDVVCEHENAITIDEQYFDIKEYDRASVDEKGHMVMGDIYVYYWCPDCELEWEEVETRATQWQSHDFYEGICMICNYKNTCKHMNKELLKDILDDYIYIDQETIYFYKYRTPSTHTRIMHYCSLGIVCQDCGELLEWEYDSIYSYFGVTERHIFNRYGICKDCGYINGACPHSNATGSEVYLNAQYTSLNKDEHSVTGYRTTAYSCPDCGESWKDYPGYNKTTATQSHNFVNGVCSDCTYSAADDPYGDSVACLPDSLDVIDEEALLGVAARTVVIPDGATTIGARAFASCPNLKYVVIPDSVRSIAADAFSGSSVSFICSIGSAAADYAQSHGIPLK